MLTQCRRRKGIKEKNKGKSDGWGRREREPLTKKVSVHRSRQPPKQVGPSTTAVTWSDPLGRTSMTGWKPPPPLGTVEVEMT